MGTVSVMIQAKNAWWGRAHTRLKAASDAVAGSSQVLRGLLGGGLLGVGGDFGLLAWCTGDTGKEWELTLLRGLLAESLAHGVRHVGWSWWRLFEELGWKL